MIRYLIYRYELKKIRKFYKMLQVFCSIEDNIKEEYQREENRGEFLRPREIQRILQKKCASRHQNYSELRNKIAQEIPKVHQIAQSVGVNTARLSFPMSTTEGHIISVDVFDSLLEDQGYELTTNTARFDTLNKIIGMLEKNKRYALLQTFNPIHWVGVILRLPFLIIQQTGFSIEKIENQLLGKTFKVLFFCAIVYLLLKLGFSHQQLSAVGGDAWEFLKKMKNYIKFKF